MTRVMVGDALVFEHERLIARMNQFFDRVESQLRQSLRAGGRSRRLDHADGRRAGAGLGADRAHRRPAAALCALGLQAPAHRAPGPGAAPAQRLSACARCSRSRSAGARAGAAAAACGLPARRSARLLVADAHIGKAVSLPPPGRAGAAAAPPRETLQRLDAALSPPPARGGIVFLGDLLHSAHARAPATLAALARWRERHAGAGADAGARQPRRPRRRPAAALGVQVVDEPLRSGRPGAVPPPAAASTAPTCWPATCTLAWCWAAARSQRLRLPCFHFGARGRRAAGLRRLHRHARGAARPGRPRLRGRRRRRAAAAASRRPYTDRMSSTAVESLIARAEACSRAWRPCCRRP